MTNLQPLRKRLSADIFLQQILLSIALVQSSINQSVLHYWKSPSQLKHLVLLVNRKSYKMLDYEEEEKIFQYHCELANYRSIKKIQLLPDALRIVQI